MFFTIHTKNLVKKFFRNKKQLEYLHSYIYGPLNMFNTSSMFSRCIHTVYTNNVCFATDTRGRCILRMNEHGTALYERLSSQVGLKIINHLQRQVKSWKIPKLSKSQYKHHLFTYVLLSWGMYGHLEGVMK